MSDVQKTIETVDDEFAEYEQIGDEEVATDAPEVQADDDLVTIAGDEVETDVDDEEDEEEDDEDLASEDSLTFSNGVIEKIVAIAMRSVPGVVGMKGGWINRLQDAFGASDARKGVTVEVTPESAVRVNVSVLIEYGAYAPQVFEDVKKAVVKQVTGMTGLAVAGVNLRIEDVLTPEEIAARNVEPERKPLVQAEPEALDEAEEPEEIEVEEGLDA